jgi:hypothetical protein
MGQITLSLEEYDALRAKQRHLQGLINKAEAERDTALTQDPTGRIPTLTAALIDAFEVIRFAVGNLDPRTIRDWPHKSLDRFANVLKDLPGASHIARETAIEFRTFAYEAALLERDRAEHPESYPSQATQEARPVPESSNGNGAKAAT